MHIYREIEQGTPIHIPRRQTTVDMLLYLHLSCVHFLWRFYFGYFKVNRRYHNISFIDISASAYISRQGQPPTLTAMLLSHLTKLLIP